MSTQKLSYPIDHVELPVGDRYEAAEWFRENLGFEVNEDYESWAEAGGPLLVSSDGGFSHLALVPKRRGSSDGASPGHIALRIPGDEFLELIDHLNDQEVTTGSGTIVSREDIIDRDLAFAVMVLDPWGNRFELITYDCEVIESKLQTDGSGEI